MRGNTMSAPNRRLSILLLALAVLLGQRASAPGNSAT